ncbi:ABC transporter ATP-binding protein [Pseudochelatococcus contaminans]|uniref:Peptide/nickel transport system ATP-binding protein n=1 Tax=Pseudochelatococcus contaminans TaxID=1538103 RepID=A0A7W5Z2J0_9HYPH|nr:ATP-binding cassette domain-containing protein [Pseudochelatococcus contaminans]MBB3808501.1 peptide/nickel transport system ATP-binding protein [Pseudochelatococcus contaminans]
MSTLLVAEDVAVFSSHLLVHPASLTLQAGRPFTILGETGSGKSLLAQAIMGTLPRGLRAEGRVTVGDQRLDLASGQGHRALWGRTLGVLPQEPWLALDPTMRARKQVEEGYRLVRGLPAVQSRIRASADLAALGLGNAGDKLPSELSGGMAQRVAFIAARAGGARIVIADEPTKGLDVFRRDEVIALLLKEIEDGGGLLTITHDLELARQMGGDIAVVLEGQIIEQGPAADVLGAPRHDYTKRLIAADPSAWPERNAAPKRSAGVKPVLTAAGLAKTRGGQLLFENRDLTVLPGEIVGITGPSGCGKSTFGDILLDLVTPDAGTVTRAEGVARVRFQKLYQDPPAAFPQKVPIRRALNDLVRLHGLDGSRIAPLLERLRLSPGLLDRLPTQVSGGELQRFALLRVLLLDPVFLFADEPTSRLDLITQQETVELLAEVARERNCAVLIVSHDAELIRKMSDRQIAFGSPPDAAALAA